MDQADIVILGGGICGVACALALQRKGFDCVVLEMSENLRVSGTSIIIASNGWYALEQLGVASTLRQTAVLIESGTRVDVTSGARTPFIFRAAEGEKPEVRSLKRKVLLEVMAGQLLPNTIQFGCRVISLKLDPDTSCPSVVALSDGRHLKAKIVIGCDGGNSIARKFIGLKNADFFPVTLLRGITRYQQGHPFDNSFMVWSSPTPTIQVGRLPMTSTEVYWFVCKGFSSKDSAIASNPQLIKESALNAVQNFPKEIEDMIIICDDSEDSLHICQARYHWPWELVRSNFHKGSVVLAGDALHSMGPFLAQGGAASIEDAVVLARCLSATIQKQEGGSVWTSASVEKAFVQYGRERRMRVVKLMTHSYLLAKLLWPSSQFGKVLTLFLLVFFGVEQGNQSDYHCGKL